MEVEMGGGELGMIAAEEEEISDTVPVRTDTRLMQGVEARAKTGAGIVMVVREGEEGKQICTLHRSKMGGGGVGSPAVTAIAARVEAPRREHGFNLFHCRIKVVG